MYIPPHFAVTDRKVIGDLIRGNNFGLLVTAPGGVIGASHLPFLLDQDSGDEGRLIAHMARVNPQWRDFATLEAEGAEAMVVFQGPHAYISPTWYRTEGPTVPTWNYIAVHAYGRPRVLDGEGAARAMLEELVTTHEADRDPPWSMTRQDPKYMEAQIRGIVAFEIPIIRLEAKAKLNQNKPASQRLAAAEGLEATGDPAALDLALSMRALAMRALDKDDVPE